MRCCKLVDAGVLDLDRPLHEYLASAEADTPRMRRVTARHVLTHTSGLPNWRHVPGPLEPATEPGKTYAYSGEAFFYLQRVVERVTGRPIARLLREEVLQPLGMTESSWVWRDDFDARMAVGYDENGNPAEVYAAIGRRTAVIAEEWHKPIEEWRYEDAARVVPLVNPAWPVLPVYMVPNVAASLLTTARDYARFLAHLVAQPGAPTGLNGRARAAPATRERDDDPAGPDQQRAGLGTRLGAAGGRVRPGRSGNGAPTTGSGTSPWPIRPTAGPSWCSPTAVTGRGSTSASSWRSPDTTTRRFSGPEPASQADQMYSRGARAGRPAVLVSDMRDQHRPKQDLINEVTGLRKQIADLREAMTARRRVEDALRQSEEQLRHLVDAAPVGLCLFRPNGTPVAANRPFARLLGYDSAAELLRVADTLGVFGSREEQGRVLSLVERGLERVAGVVFRRKDGTRQAFGVIGSLATDSQALVLVVLERQPQPWRSAPLAALSPAWSSGSRTG